MTAPLGIAIAGLGTVGAGTARLLQTHADLLARRCSRRLELRAVSARDKSRNRGIDLADVAWFDDPVQMATEAKVDIVVELIGGAEGIARDLCMAALDAGRDVVTANKALLAYSGVALAAAAEKRGVTLAYEASVAGGIPVVKTLRDGLAGNSIDALYGILNGTCNFILSVMRSSGRSFEEALAEAQTLGYAEADPGFDIGGHDTAHKLAILACLAFGTEIDHAGIHVEGITRIAADDIAYAEELGYRIKLLGIAENLENGIRQRVHPALVSADAPMAAVEGAFNAVITQGDFVGTTVLEGQGAGAGPTASAVVADIVDIACGLRRPVFGLPAETLEKSRSLAMEDHRGAYYVRLMVVDRPGIFAEIATALADCEISLQSVIQRGRSETEAVPVVLTTHQTSEAAMQRVLDAFTAMDDVREPPVMIRIEGMAEEA